MKSNLFEVGVSSRVVYALPLGEVKVSHFNSAELAALKIVIFCIVFYLSWFIVFVGFFYQSYVTVTKKCKICVF